MYIQILKEENLFQIIFEIHCQSKCVAAVLFSEVKTVNKRELYAESFELCWEFQCYSRPKVKLPRRSCY